MSVAQPEGATRHVRTTGGSTRSDKRTPKVENTSKDWTIKSLSPEAIEVSRDAAKRSGMKINAWVGKALMSAATDPEAEKNSSDDRRAEHTDREMVKLEHSILKEISDLKSQNESLTQTVNSISSMLLKMYSKID